MTPTYPQALEIAKLIKKQEDIPICIGGPHATFLPEDVLSEGVFDFVVRGEGELTLLELCKTLQNNGKLKSIAGLSFTRNKKIIHVQSRELIQNLDLLPRPAYHLLPFDKYQQRAPASFIRRLPWLTMVTSRGCPFACKFCSATTFWGRVWRSHSIQRILEDIMYLLNCYNLRSIFFSDDNFTFSKKRVVEFCDEIRKNRLEFEWSCNCRVDQVDLKLLDKMHNSGCWRIGFGIEAGTQDTLDWYGKRITLEQAKNAIKNCKRVGISPACYFILGAPIETKEMIEKTIKFAIELDPDVVGFSYLVPFPGSELYDSIDKSMILTKKWERYAQNIPIIKPTFPIECLQELSKNAYQKFYFRPKYMFRQFMSISKNPKIAWSGFKTILNWMKPIKNPQR
jgi:radical SAM superfamily enzyme YgiQ (UPF0313 family)